MKVKLEQGAIAPTRAHETDAGLDLYAYDEGYIQGHNFKVFRTGVHVELPHGTCGIIMSKSGLNTKYGLTTTGLIDEGYTGEIMVALHNNRYSEYKVRKGDKIAQLVVTPCLYVSVEVTDEITGGDRGESGFGSSGR